MLDFSLENKPSCFMFDMLEFECSVIVRGIGVKSDLVHEVDQMLNHSCSIIFSI